MLLQQSEQADEHIAAVHLLWSGSLGWNSIGSSSSPLDPVHNSCFGHRRCLREAGQDIGILPGRESREAGKESQKCRPRKSIVPET